MVEKLPFLPIELYFRLYGIWSRSAMNPLNWDLRN